MELETVNHTSNGNHVQNGLSKETCLDEKTESVTGTEQKLEKTNKSQALKGTSAEPEAEEEEDKRCCCSTRSKAYRNVFGTGFSFMMSLSAVVSLFSLQSSLNPELGLASLTVFMGFFLISGLFASTIIHILTTKYTLIFSYTLLGVYTVANYYAHWYTLIPAAIFGGMGFGPVFAASNVHVTTVAIRYASALKERPEYLVSLFAGIQAMFFKVAYIPGSFATFAILFSERAAGNESEVIDTDVVNVCNNTEAATLNQTYIYILLSVYVSFDLIAIIVCFLLLDRLQENVWTCHSFGRVWKVYFKKPLLSTLKMFTSWKMYMIIPMMILDGFLASFALGTFYKVFVSDCIGVHWVGLVTGLFGICSGLSAVVGGRLAKCVPQFIIVYVVSAVLAALMFFLIFWERVPSYIVPFVAIAIWGICEGIWHSVPPSLVGILFHKKQEPAFSVSRMGLATGMILGFSTAIFLKYKYLLWIAFSFLIITLVVYSILVFKTLSKHQLFPACFEEPEEERKEEEEEYAEEKEDSLPEAPITENVF